MSDVCHAHNHREPHYIIIHMEKEAEEGAGNIDSTKKPEQAYSQILEDDDCKSTLLLL